MDYKIIQGDCLKRLNELKNSSIDCVFTSPPPFTESGDILYLSATCKKLHNILKDEGSLWINIGDSHDETGALRIWCQDFIYGMVARYHWDLIDSLIWYRPPRTEKGKYDWGTGTAAGGTERFKHDYDFIHRFVKTGKLSQTYFDKTQTDAWTSSIFRASLRDVQLGEADSGFPHEIIKACLLITCPPGGTVLDPYCGWGSTGVVALENGMNFIGIEQDKSMIEQIKKRFSSIVSDTNIPKTM